MSELPNVMRAAVLMHHGGPEAVLVREAPTPEPGPGEVLVRVAAAGCNNTDLWTREGRYGLSGNDGAPAGWKGRLTFPRIQGGDVAGRIVAVGQHVAADLVQARVLVDPALYVGEGPQSLVDDVLGSERDGGFAEYVVVPAASVHRVDDSPLSDIELGALPIAYGTALGMLERGSVGSGHTVLVTGASGGVGLAAVQLAAARGAHVVAVSSGDKVLSVADAGASDVIDRWRGSVLDDARDAAPNGFDVVIDVVAGAAVGPGVGLLNPGGRWVVAGALDGHLVEFDVRSLYLQNRALIGSTMHTREHFSSLVAIAQRGQIRPVVAGTFDLVDIHEAHRQLSERRHVGKLVVTLKDTH